MIFSIDPSPAPGLARGTSPGCFQPFSPTQDPATDVDRHPLVVTDMVKAFRIVSWQPDQLKRFGTSSVWPFTVLSSLPSMDIELRLTTDSVDCCRVF